MGQLQKKAGPPVPMPSANRAKVPVLTEIYENATAKFENNPSERCNSCL